MVQNERALKDGKRLDLLESFALFGVGFFVSSQSPFSINNPGTDACRVRQPPFRGELRSATSSFKVAQIKSVCFQVLKLSWGWTVG